MTAYEIALFIFLILPGIAAWKWWHRKIREELEAPVEPDEHSELVL